MRYKVFVAIITIFTTQYSYSASIDSPFVYTMNCAWLDESGKVNKRSGTQIFTVKKTSQKDGTIDISGPVYPDGSEDKFTGEKRLYVMNVSGAFGSNDTYKEYYWMGTTRLSVVSKGKWDDVFIEMDFVTSPALGVSRLRCKRINNGS